MSNNRKIFITIEALLFLILLIFAALMLFDYNRRGEKTVSVILQNMDDGKWAAFRYGQEKAASDFGLELVYSGTGSMMTAEEEEKIIEKEMNRGRDCVILQPVKEEKTSSMLKTMSQIPLVLLEGGDLENGDCQVRADHYEMGVRLADEMKNDYGENLAGKTIGLLLDGSSYASEERKNGFLSEMEKMGVKLAWVREENTYDLLLNKLESSTTTDLLVTLDETSSLVAGKYFQTEKPGKSVLYGIGNSMKTVYYLDTKVFQCLIIPDDFLAGYISIQKANDIINGKYGGKYQKVSYYVLREQDIFSEENKQLLFAISQ